MEPAAEGSDERKHARAVLMEHARNAHAQGASFDGWQDRESQTLLDTVTQRDLDAIYHLTWQRKRRR